MAPSRFLAASPFKNVQANIAKKENWFLELPLSTSSPLEASNGIQASTEYSVVRGSSVGSLLFLEHGKPGKYGQKAATWNASGRPVTDFALSHVEPLIACASEDGRITVASMPVLSDVSAGAGGALTPDAVASLSAPAQRAVEVVQFHPTSSGLLLSNQSSDTQIWDIHAGKAALALKGAEKGHWSVGWSSDGRFVHTAGKDNTVSVWDVRNSTEKASSFATGHQGFNKPSRITSINEDLILTTGFSKTRDRECSLWDARNFAKPVSNIRLDTNTGVLMPLVDQARKMVYLIGRADMSLRWIEVTSTSTLTQGAATLPTASVGAAILPSTSTTLDVMQAEVAKLVILGQDAVIPVTIQVPRRNYLDFHAELYPPHRLYQSPAQGAVSWLEGADEQVETVVPAPKSDWGVGSSARSAKQEQNAPAPVAVASSGAAPRAAAQPRAEAVPPQSVEKPLAPVQSPKPAVTSEDKSSPPPIDAIDNQLEKVKLSKTEVGLGKTGDVTAGTSTQSAAIPPVEKQGPPAPSFEQARPTAVSDSSRASQSQQSAAQTPTRAAGPGAHWSRSFLAGKTALKPDYEDVHGVATTLGASVQLLKVSGTHLFYPLAGPGGRLAVHPISAKGRLPVHAPSLACGSDIIDFVLDPFDERRVYLACQDAKIRVFRVPEQLEGDYGETEVVLDDGADKLLEMQAHPTIKGLLLCVCDDRGDATLRVWDTRAGRVIAKATVPGKGIHSVAWDALGARVVVSCKDKKIRIIDPRSASVEPIAGPSHDSVRPSKVVWVDDKHLVTSGFSRSAFREILLHRVADNGRGLEIIGKTQIDVSPAPLFPHYDPDTNILFAFSKGERTCHAYEVNTADKSKPFTKLPSFEHGQLQSAFAFLPKQTVDVGKVEVARAYRLTPASIQHVSFSIPRAKMDFFQDDIFPPTLDYLAPSPNVGPQEWQSGQDTKAKYVDLRPEGMPLLSEAPAPAPRTKQQVMRKQMTEEESQQQYLDSLFKNKQAEVDSDSDAERRRRRDEVDDDDDW